MTLPSTLLETTQSDIERLVADRIQEGPHLDFKRDLPSAWDNGAKHELLADATSFANSGGGDIIYGIDENAAAEAHAICPQKLANLDAEVRRLQDFLLSLSEPRLPGVQVYAVEVSVGATKGYVIVLRVPQSWAAPHRVKTNQHVYVREGLRKRPLDVPELRAFFLRTESQAQRVRDFRTDRLARVLTGDTPAPLKPGPRLVVHAIPTHAAFGLMQVNPLVYSRRKRELPVLGGETMSSLALNFDGAYGILPTAGPTSLGYTQVFRQGYFEGVWVLSPAGDVNEPLLPGTAYEKHVNQFVSQVRRELNSDGLPLETSVFLSLLGADKVVFAGPSDTGFGYAHYRFDRKQLLLPDVLISAEMSPGKGMRPAYDLMCQSVGLEGSANYDPDGEWKESK